MHKLESSIPSSVAILQVACKYLCLNNCLVLVLTLCSSFVEKKNFFALYKGGRTMIGRNSIVKDSENFSEHKAKKCLNIPYRCRENLKNRNDFT